MTFSEAVADEPVIVGHLAGQPDAASTGQDSESEAAKRLSRRALLVRRFVRNRLAVAGLVVLALLVVLAIVGPRWIAQWGYSEIDRGYYLQPPSSRHWFGTTQQGRDVFAMTMRGLGKSLLIGFFVGLGATAIAAVVGSFAAYFQGWVDRVALWVVDLLLILPSFLIVALIMRNVAGGSSVWVLIIVLALFGWMLSARIVRSLTLSVRDREYVTAARYMGVSGPRIVFRHIIPNISSLLIIDATLGIGAAVLAETSLSFFGLGIRPPETSLGTLIGEGSRMATTFPWVFLAGAIPLVMIVLAVNVVGDGLRDAVDPTSGAGGRG